MYKLNKPPLGETQSQAVIRLSDTAFIPFEPSNTDYQKFKFDVMSGAELQDADGNVMTSEEAIAFISNLPY